MVAHGTRALIPGADPLLALKAPLACLCQQWKKEGAAILLLSDIERWMRA